MRILEIRIKNFGKFSDRRICFHEGMNILYGKNEAGKSTVHAFLRAMLFGIERARGRRAGSDEYSLREPWDHPGYFAGVMWFESGGKVFRLERNFNRREKSVSLVCETDGEELSVESGDLDVLLEGLNETSYRNTFFVGQSGAATEEELAKELHHYMSNLQNAGDTEIDVNQAVAALEAKRRQLEAEKKKVQAERETQEREVQTRLAYVRQEAERLAKEEAECTEKLRRTREEYRQAAALEKEQKEKDHQQTTQRMKGRPEKETVSRHRPSESGISPDCCPKKASSHQEEIFAALAVGALGILGCVFLPWLWAKYAAGVVCACGVFALIKILRESEGRNREEKRRIFSEEEDTWSYQEEKECPSEAAGSFEEKERLSAGQVRQQRLIRLSGQIEKQKGHLEHIHSELREKQTILENLRENLSELCEGEEGTARLEQEIQALQMAAVAVREASKEVCGQWEGRLNRQVSEILGELTCGRYTSIFLDDSLHIRINTPEKLLGIWQVSRGTMEQIYFALRMAAGEILTGGEQVPVILDEAFAMYDDERLEQTLRWLKVHKEQVILFTCQERENRILQKIREETESVSIGY